MARHRKHSSKNSTNPKISIVIPTLNEEKRIEASLRSVIKQNYDNYEIILVDGYSKDRTRKIAKKFVDKIVMSSKRGRQVQGNVGAKNAKGDILVMLHADTRMQSPNVLKSMSQVLKDPEFVAGVCSRKFDSKKLKYTLWEKANEIQLKIMRNICSGSCAPFFRRDLFVKVGGFDEDALMEDIDITIKMKKHGKIGKIDETVMVSVRRFEEEGLIRVLWRWFYSGMLLYLGRKTNPEYRHIRLNETKKDEN